MIAPRASKSAAAPEGRSGFVRGVWERIKAHKVVQWTLTYLAVAYTLLHGAEMLTSSLSWPHAWLRVFALLLILGLPLAVTYAWYHGTYARQRVSATEVMIIAILLAVGGTLVWRDTTTRHQSEGARAAGESQPGVPPPAAPAASIAVLPFADLSPGGDQGYFSDGVTEEILNVLARVSGLKVASRTSSFRFRNSELGVPDIARALGVRHILEGSVRKAGDTVRITAQLVDAVTDQHLWSQDFDRPLTTANLFGIQDEIAADIVERLASTIGPDAKVGRPALPQADTASVDVYDLYLKGHALFLARTRPNLSEAARLLKAAVDKDPKFARAWESLAAVMVVSQVWGLKEEADYDQQAIAAADRALELDPGLSLPYAVRGKARGNRIALGEGGSWDEAITPLDEAVRRDPKNATAFLWRAGHLVALGYLERGSADLERCLALDPAYETCRRNLAFLELCAGRTDEALRLYEVGLAQDYVNDDVYFAPAIAARGDRIGALGALLEQFRARPQLLQALFRAVTVPKFSDADRKQALALVDTVKDDQEAARGAVWVLKDYERMQQYFTDYPATIWARSDPEWLKSQTRKRMIVSWRLPEYWRAHGFPPQCKPLGAGDFTCP
ncbi:MAG: tetratricopeptide repeat protein [Steroidobacteraceae bacterium]